ncbi:hypothetical protein ALC53_05680 [Atta colombica]|uniref:Uncharacterized protein n=1 Tax=Atta colombica TaxID=520822 RepID=A0A151I3L0_9HYME|nr:hypothetical protein ALC53_05680 [Atta colombica]
MRWLKGSSAMKSKEQWTRQAFQERSETMKPLSINAGSDLRRNLSMRVYRIACAFANCIHTRSSLLDGRGQFETLLATPGEGSNLVGTR